MLRSLILLASVPLFASMAMACSASLRRGVTTTEAATQIQQVTYSRTNELDPAISRDATAIAYEVADSPDSTSHVEVMALKDVGAENPARLEFGAKNAMGREPAWMPDGSGLVFVSDALGFHRLVQTFGQSHAAPAFMVNAGDPNLFAAWPAVSPDGTKMAMSLGRTQEFRSGWQRARSLDTTLAVSDLVGSGVTILGTGTDPAWSPDGRRIAFVRASGDRAHVFVVGANGGDATQITEGPDDDVEPAWSPDGKFLAFCSARGTEHHWSRANLFVVHADGSDLVQLTEGDHVSCRPAWGQDGFIYFHANATGNFHIWRIRPKGSFADERAPVDP